MSIETLETIAGERAAILDRVGRWPAEFRLSLALAILGTLGKDLIPDRPSATEATSGPDSSPARPKGSLRALHGLLRGEGPPLTDEECDRIVHEERMRRYGS